MGIEDWQRGYEVASRYLKDKENMALITRRKAYAAAQAYLNANATRFDSSEDVLNSQIQRLSETRQYDIFLSHSYLDAKLLLGVKALFEQHGYITYIDWINDQQLSRGDVTSHTARTLRARISNCKSLLYISSDNSANSKWMPWELGYADALNKKVAICPVTEERRFNFHGTEYLGLYPYVEFLTPPSGSDIICVSDAEDEQSYISFQRWLLGQEPHRHAAL